MFLIYINDLPNCLKSTVPCLYADDTQIFTSSHDPTKISDNLNSDLENITDWLIVNKLQSHPTKTKMMVIGSRHNLNVKVADLRSNIKINNNDVSPVFSQKCLGIYLDEWFNVNSCKYSYFMLFCYKILSSHRPLGQKHMEMLAGMFC